MSKTVDSRVVEMQFDNRNFEQNVGTTLSTLDKLKKGLDLKGASKGLDGLTTAANKVDLESVVRSLEPIQTKFSALGSMMNATIMNLTNTAVNAGKRIVSALTIDPIKTGFNEYETKINAIQTIMSNTASKGTTMKDVTEVLDELNRYADKTIYNFAEMARNIGTFTAAGVGLKDSAAAIQGIANLAASSGSTSEQASTAMYQLSQALAAGTVKLMDWNSVVNAGMGGQKFQDALKATAKEHGVAIDKIIKKQGSFRNSLQEGWLSASILNDTLKKFTVDGAEKYAAGMVKSGKWTEKQAAALIKEANAMNDAATKVKTFTQLWSTLTEAAQSGWAQTWELIVGNFVEAKKLLTDISNVLGGMINNSATARLNLVKGWKELGGRKAIIDAVRNSFEGIMSVVKLVGQAFREIFPPVTAKQLAAFSMGLRDLTAKFKLSEKTSADLKSTFKGLFAILSIMSQIFMAIVKGVISLLGAFTGLGGGVLSVTGTFGEWLVKLDEAAKKSDVFNNVIQSIVGFIKMAITAFKSFIDVIKEKFDFSGLTIFNSFFEGLQNRMSQVGEATGSMKLGVVSVIEAMGKAIAGSNMLQILTNLWNGITTIVGGISSIIGTIIGSMVDGLGNANFNGLFDSLNTAVLIGIGLSIRKFFNNLSDLTKGAPGIIDKLKGILDSVRGSLQAWQQNLKAGTLLKIAGAIGILAVSLLIISTIDSKKLTKALGAITALFADLMGSMMIFDKFGSKLSGVTSVVTFMIGISVAILILSSAMKKIGDLKTESLAKGIMGIVALTAIMISASKIMAKDSGQIAKGAMQMVIFAVAIKILASACEDLSKLSWNELAKGLVGVGVLLAEISIFLNTAKFSGKSVTTALGIMILAGAIYILGSACKQFATMSWEEIGKGLASIGAILAEITLFTKLTGNAKNVIFTGLALIAIAAAMKIFASAIKDMAGMTWAELGKGLVGMAGALLAVAVAVNLMPKNMLVTGMGLIAVSLALAIMAKVLQQLGGMTWESIAKGLVALGASVAILAIGLNAMNGAILGAAALIIAAGALAIMAPVLSLLGAMSWEGIAKGLIVLAGAFAIIGIAGYLLAPIVPAILALAASFALIGVAMLGIGLGLLAAGAGLSAIAIGFTALVAAVVGGAAALVAGLTAVIIGIANIIPTVAIKIGEGITVLIGTIAKNASTIADAVKVMVIAIVGILVECIPLIADGALKLLVGVMAALVKYTPQIVELLMQFVINILNAISAKLPTLIAAAVGVIKKLFKGIGNAIGQFVGGMIGGIAEGVTSALPSIATDLSNFMKNLKPFLNAAKSIDASFLDSVKAIVAAVVYLTGANILNRIGTLASGGTTLGDFAKQLVPFGVGIKQYANAVAGINPEEITASGVAAKGIVEVVKSIPRDNGIWQKIAGNRNLGDFAKQLIPFGNSMKLYSNAVSGINAAGITASVSAAKGMAQVAKAIPSSGGWLQKIAGNKNLGDFGNKLVPLGYAMSKYSIAVSRVNTTAINNSATGIYKLAKVINSLSNLDISGVSSFQTALTSLSKASINGVVRAFSSSSAKLASVGSNIANALVRGFKSKQSALTSIASAMVNAAYKIISSRQSNFNKAGAYLMNALIAGMKVNAAKVSVTVIASITKAVLGIRSHYRNFYSAGSYLGAGLVIGIGSKQDSVYNAGYRLGKKAVQGERDGQHSHSPSKDTIQSGKWFGEGLVIGIKSTASRVYTTSRDLGDTAVKSMSSAISRISDSVNSNIDAQPTIRPVLDLDNIKSGASTIGDMFSMKPSVGLLSTVGSIDTMMNVKNQNGENSNIVSAIKDLRKELGNLERPSYNVNGVTYDDGSNVTNAVKDLVRAAKVERRC